MLVTVVTQLQLVTHLYIYILLNTTVSCVKKTIKFPILVPQVSTQSADIVYIELNCVSLIMLY